jgi:hypothetical protein
MSAASRLWLPPVAPWMLNDLSPGGAPPHTPKDELHFGLFRVDGSAKPAAGLVAKYFSGKRIAISVNNSFEDTARVGHYELPTLWRRYGQRYAKIRSDLSQAHSGSASIQIGHMNRNNLRGMASEWIVPVNSAVSTGRTVAGSVWARGANVTGLTTLSLSFFNVRGVYIGQLQSRPVPSGDFGWTRFIAKGAVPAGASYVRIYLKSFGDAGTVWFDDVSWEP